MTREDEFRHSAEEKFKQKERRRSEAAQAMAEYEAANRAVDENTARLRSLRLARDAALAHAKPGKTKPARRERV